MKTPEQVDHARRVVKDKLGLPGLSQDQKLLLVGISTALQWVAGVGGATLELLVRGMPLGAGMTVDDVREAAKGDAVLRETISRVLGDRPPR